MEFNRKHVLYPCCALIVILLALASPCLLKSTAQARPLYDGPCNLAVNVVGGGTVTAVTQGGSIDPDLGMEIASDHSFVILENSQIKVKYGPFFENHAQFAIKELRIKSAGDQNQVRSYLDAAANRGVLADASMVYDGPDRKTVRLEWNDRLDDPEKKVIHEVSIFPNSKFIKIDYIDVQYGVNIVDSGRPGGTINGIHVAYGGDTWIRDYVTLEYTPTVGSYYNRYPPDGVNDPVDGGSLNYNGYFIVGAYNPANDMGLGRVMPVADTHIIKLLSADDERHGFELFPHPFFNPHAPFTGYVYVVTGGEAEVLSLGQQLADGDYGPSGYQCGDDVNLTATPYSGWTFAGWSGELSGSANPVTLTLAGDYVVIATFEPEPDTSPPTIDVWYDSHQVFGQLGVPQQWVNILGNVSDAESGVASLTYSLNGVSGSPSLSIGPDSRRLVNPGDFNIELDKDSLVSGANTVVITATDNATNQAVETVTVAYDNDNVWPLPYSIDWSLVTDVQDAVQIVDGVWTWGAGGIRTAQVGYDRIVAIGDMTWNDYEVTVPITVHETFPEYGVPGTGITMRWRGHTNSPVYCPQPHCGWLPTGASGWYDWGLDGGTWFIGGDYGHLATDTSGRHMELGVPYYWKMRAETISGPSTIYSFKVWKAGDPEPSAWDLTGQEGASDVSSGSFLLVAHNVDATFGDVTVVPAGGLTRTLTVRTVGSGTVIVDPDQSEYLSGTPVALTTVPDNGWVFTGWSGDLSGSANPATMYMTTDKVVTATTTEATSHTLTVRTAGSGTVTVDPDQSEYLYGTVVTVTALARPGWVFADWSGGSSGSTNPVALTMTDDKMVTATFTTVPSGTIASDDFNSCALSQFWTHYPGRPGDPAPVMSGTHVSLSVPAGEDHDIWESGTFASRIMQPADDTDFEVEVKFDSQLGAKYQMQGVLVEQDNGDVLRFEFLHDGSGTRLFAASIISGSADGKYYVATTGGTGTPPYMKVERTGDVWTHSYSFDGTTWTDRTFTQVFTVTKVGVYAGNTADNPPDSPAHTAVVDYFYNTASPGPGDVDENTLVLKHVGSGAVAKEPNQTAYACGEVVTLTATADLGWSFDSWSGDLIGTTNPDTLTITGDHVVTATFTQDQYTLAVNTVEAGDVSKDPNQATYTYGQVVTLTAQADPGWSFDSWSGDLSGSTNPVTITMDSAKTVTATFTQDEYTVVVNTVGSGSVISEPVKATYHYSDVVTFTAMADLGWTFVGWSGDLSGTENPDTVTIAGNTTVTATFSDEYTLTVNVVGGGTVDKDPDRGTYRYGEVVTLTANADPGWAFASWSGDLSGTENPNVVTITGTATVTATFTPYEYTITVNTVGSGSVISEPVKATYHYSDVVTFTAMADLGWTLVGWSGDLSGTENPDTVTITGNTIVTATFTQDEYTLSVGIVGSGSVVSEPVKSIYRYGDVVTLTASADAGWRFIEWSGDLSGSANPETITMDGNKAVVATFSDEYTLTVNVVGGGTVDKDPDRGTYRYGEVVTLTANADPGWAFASWSGDLSGTENPNAITITGTATVTATFTTHQIFLPLITVRYVQ